MFCYFKKCGNTTEKQINVCASHGEGAVPGQMCQKCFAKFWAGVFSLYNGSCLGKPVQVDSIQIKTLIEKNQHYTYGR